MLVQFIAAAIPIYCIFGGMVAFIIHKGQMTGFAPIAIFLWPAWIVLEIGKGAVRAI